MSSRALARKAAVIVSSTRAAAGEYDDLTGPVIVTWLDERSFTTSGARVVPDGDAVGQALDDALAAGCDVVLTTGGTGIAPSDVTPEQTAPRLVAELPGLAEAVRARGVGNGVPTAVLSRGVAGVAPSANSRGRAVVVNLPGSRGGVRDGLAVLDQVLDHALAQLDGGTH